ncbi:hypothetical protein K8O68_06515 [Salipaludibacillus sp. CUR1]|uniref:hypothetical protein n=1 Tax=Salipaludibacillus sp. CUR1 TaxID=2820003 RepID=UPI001E28AFEF|nr:hypothetical protein [Salipaludibacillus sp. CUR1]MCE7792074.1 hypothetical protein [Salipaludibacillus sp. CUR1]
MQIEVLFTLLIGIIIMGLGSLIYLKKALFLVNFNSWTVFGDHQVPVAKILGFLVFIVGVAVVFLPLIFGTENINPL